MVSKLHKFSVEFSSHRTSICKCISSNFILSYIQFSREQYSNVPSQIMILHVLCSTVFTRACTIAFQFFITTKITTFILTTRWIFLYCLLFSLFLVWRDVFRGCTTSQQTILLLMRGVIVLRLLMLLLLGLLIHHHYHIHLLLQLKLFMLLLLLLT